MCAEFIKKFVSLFLIGSAKVDATYSYLLPQMPLLSLSSHVFISQCFFLYLAFACLLQPSYNN